MWPPLPPPSPKFTDTHYRYGSTINHLGEGGEDFRRFFFPRRASGLNYFFLCLWFQFFLGEPPVSIFFLVEPPVSVFFPEASGINFYFAIFTTSPPQMIDGWHPIRTTLSVPTAEMLTSFLESLAMSYLTLNPLHPFWMRLHPEHASCNPASKYNINRCVWDRKDSRGSYLIVFWSCGSVYMIFSVLCSGFSITWHTTGMDVLGLGIFPEGVASNILLLTRSSCWCSCGVL